MLKIRRAVLELINEDCIVLEKKKGNKKFCDMAERAYIDDVVGSFPFLIKWKDSHVNKEDKAFLQGCLDVVTVCLMFASRRYTPQEFLSEIKGEDDKITANGLKSRAVVEYEQLAGRNYFADYCDVWMLICILDEEDYPYLCKFRESVVRMSKEVNELDSIKEKVLQFFRGISTKWLDRQARQML